MRLSKAFDMTVVYTGNTRVVKVDKDGFVCLNDLAEFFPNKVVKEWLSNKNTKEFIVVMEKFLKGGKDTLLKIDDFGSRGAVPKGLLSIKTKSGRYGGGTYAHETLALKFAMWLSPEFELNVLLAYQNGTQTKTDWNIKRELAAENYKLQTESISNSIEGDYPNGAGYINNALLLNEIVFKKHFKGIRDGASAEALEQLSYLESKNSAYIDLGLDYENRKVILKKLYNNKYGIKQLEVGKND